MNHQIQCFYCASEPEPGWIETPNNGPIERCPFCNPEPEPDDDTKAEQQRDERAP